MPIPEFNFETRDGARMWISPAYGDAQFADSLSDPDRLLSDTGCHVIKDEKKMKVGHLTVNIGGTPRSLYIKRYNAFSLRYALVSSVVKSGALRSLRGALALCKAGIPSVTPVAAVENRRCGIVYKSFFISEEILDAKTADAYWKENLQKLKGREGFNRRRAFLRQLAGVFQQLHAQQIDHGDLKDANILVLADPDGRSFRLFLLDLERVRRYSRLSQRRQVKSLVQLYRTLGRHVPQPQQLLFLKSYLGAPFADRRLRRQWIQRVEAVARRVERLKARRAMIQACLKYVG